MKYKAPTIGTKINLTVVDVNGTKVEIKGFEQGTEEDITTLMFSYLNSKNQLTRMFELMLNAAGFGGNDDE